MFNLDAEYDDQDYYIGGQTELWDTTWNAEVINSSRLGIVFCLDDGDVSTEDELWLDAITLTVYFSAIVADSLVLDSVSSTSAMARIFTSGATADTILLKWGDSNPPTAITDTIISGITNPDTIIKTGLSSGQKYFAQAIVSNSGYRDTSNIDSVTTPQINIDSTKFAEVSLTKMAITGYFSGIVGTVDTVKIRYDTLPSIGYTKTKTKTNNPFTDTLTSLKPLTKYYYRVVIYDGSYDTSAIDSFTTVNIVVDSTRAIDSSSTGASVDIYFSYADGSLYSVVIKADTFKPPTTVRNTHYTISNPDTVTISGLQPIKKYYYKLIAYEHTGWGNYSAESEIDSFTTLWVAGTPYPKSECVTTWKSEKTRGVSGEGEYNPNEKVPKELTTQKPYFSAIATLNNTTACSIKVGLTPNDFYWTGYASFSAIDSGVRCPNVPYTSSSILQDGLTYYWKIRFYSSGSWRPYGAVNTFEGVVPSNWWSKAYKYRRNIRLGNEHSFLYPSHPIRVEFESGSGEPLTDIGVPYQSVNFGQQVSYNGFLYISWMAVADTTGARKIFVRKYKYATGQWSEPVAVFWSRGEFHFNPVLSIGPESQPKLHLYCGGHFNAMWEFHTRNGDINDGNGIDITSWKGDYGKPTSVADSILVDTTKNWIPDEFVGYYVQIMGGPGGGPLSRTKIIHNTADSIFLDTNWIMPTNPDTSSRYNIFREVKGAEISSYPFPVSLNGVSYVFFRLDKSLAYSRYYPEGDSFSGPKYVIVYHDNKQLDGRLYGCVAHYDGNDNKRVGLLVTFWDDYGKNLTGNRGRAITYIYSDVDSATGHLLYWYDIAGNFVGKIQDNQTPVDSTIDYQSCTNKIWTCQNPTVNPLVGPFIGASNQQNLTMDSLGYPYITFATYDNNNVSKCQEFFARWDTLKNKWRIDNLSGVTRFRAKHMGNRNYFTVKVNSGSVSGRKITITNGGGWSQTFDNLATPEMIRDIDSDSIEVAFVGISLPDTTSSALSFTGGADSAYSYRDIPTSADRYDLWNFRHGGNIVADFANDRVFVYGFILPAETTQYFSGELVRWRGIGLYDTSGPTWTRTILSYHSGGGAGRISTLPRVYPLGDRSLIYARGRAVIADNDVDYFDMPNQIDGDDIRIVVGSFASSGDTATWLEYDRLPDNCWQLSNNKIIFRLPTLSYQNSPNIPNKVIQVYYGCDTCSNPPSNVSNVFRYDSTHSYFENFELDSAGTKIENKTGWQGSDYDSSYSIAKVCAYDRSDIYEETSVERLYRGKNFLYLKGYNFWYYPLSDSITLPVEVSLYVTEIMRGQCGLGVLYQKSSSSLYRFSAITVDGGLNVGCLNVSAPSIDSINILAKNTVWSDYGDVEDKWYNKLSIRWKSDNVWLYANDNLVYNAIHSSSKLGAIVLFQKGTVSGDTAIACVDELAISTFATDEPETELTPMQAIGGTRRAKIMKEVIINEP